MFGVDSSELIIVAVLALLFIGPKELPSAMRTAGRWVGKIRAISRHFTSGLEAMIREAELEKVPYVIVYGDQESDDSLAIRERHGAQSTKSLDELFKDLARL